MLNTISGLLGAPAPLIPTDYESISTVTVGSGGSSTVTFSSIPSTYSHLQIRLIAQETAATSDDNLTFRFNSDTASNYSFHDLYGSGATATADGYASTINMIGARITGASATNIFGAGVIDILDYANTNKYKTIRSLSGHDNNGSGYIWFASGNWRSTTAISTITFTAGSGNIAQYSSFALYGIK